MEKFTTQNVTFKQDGGVAWVSISRPDARNSLCEDTLQELLDIFTYCRESESLRAVVLKGEGRVFCSGGDVLFFQNLLKLPAQARREPLSCYIGLAHQVILALANISCPVIAVVHGAAAGYGMSLACLADIIVADSGCKFVPAYVALGTTPDGGLTYVLPAVIGDKRALDILLFNRTVEMSDAHQWGLVSYVTTSEMLAETAVKLAGELASGPSPALNQLKTLIKGRSLTGLAAHLDRELESFLVCAASADFEEGVGAFIAKREAVFGG